MITDVQLAALSNWLGSFGMVLIVIYHVGALVKPAIALHLTLHYYLTAVCRQCSTSGGTESGGSVSKCDIEEADAARIVQGEGMPA